MSTNDDKVIYVSFGPGGGKRKVPPPTTSSSQPSFMNVPPGAKEPTYDLYSMSDVSKLFNIRIGRLKYWERSGFIKRSGKVKNRRFYTFQDLIGIRAAIGLLGKGIELRDVRRSVEALRISLPRVTRPLSTLRIVADGRSLVVRDDNCSYEPDTGQLVLNFDISSLRDDVVRSLRRSSWSTDTRAAYEYYLEGCRLDQDEETLDRAEKAYRRAIELDPSLANAYTNLGNLLFYREQNDLAEQMYRRALCVDPEQPEAFYNLGFLAYERGDLRAAEYNFMSALKAEQAFADAHFNLAMVLEEMDRCDQARQHWEAYLKLDPDSSWAEIARRHLGVGQ